MKTNARSGTARSRVFQSRLPSPSCAQPPLHASAHVPESLPVRLWGRGGTQT